MFTFLRSRKFWASVFSAILTVALCIMVSSNANAITYMAFLR